MPESLATRDNLIPPSISESVPAAHLLIQLVREYLEGLDLHELKKRIADICKENKQNEYFIFNSTVIDEEFRIYILNALNVSDTSVFEKDDTLFKLLDHLNHEGYGYHHLDFLIQQINFSYYSNLIIKTLATLITIPLLSLVMLHIFDKKMIETLSQQIFDSFVNILKRGFQSIGLIHFASINQFSFNAIILIVLIYDTFKYGFNDFDRKLKKIIFPSAAALLNITGTILSELTSLGSLVSSCFLIASFLDTANALVSYYLVTSTAEGKTAEDRLRKKAQTEEAAEILKIRLISSILTISAGLTLLFFPQLFVPYCLFMGSIFIIRETNLILIKERYTQALQENIRQNDLSI